MDVSVRLWGGLAILSALSVGLGGCQVSKSQEQSPVARLIVKLGGGSSAQEREKLINDLLSSDADLRREAVMKLGRGQAARWDITPKILENRALGDESGQVRAAAVQVYAKLDRSEKLPEVLRQAAGDTDVRVRRECVWALSRRRDKQSMEVLLKLLGEDKEALIRGESAAGLGSYRERQAVQGLIGALDDEEFGVSYRVLRSLRQLTGQDFGYDRQGWQDWFYATNDTFGAKDNRKN